jgi:hypothetical protein
MAEAVTGIRRIEPLRFLGPRVESDVAELSSLSTAFLALLGEEGRKEFVKEVARQHGNYHSDIRHCRTWSKLVRPV